MNINKHETDPIKSMSAASSYQDNIDKIMGGHSIQSAMKAMSAASSYQDNIDKILGDRSIQSAMKAISAASSHQDNIDKILGGHSIQSAMKAMSAASSYQDNIDKIMGSHSIQSAMKAMSAASSYQDNIDKIMGGHSIQSAMKAMSAASSHQDNIDKIMGGHSIQSAMKAISTVSSHQEPLANILNRNSFRNAFDVFSEPSNLFATLDLITRAEKDIFATELSEVEVANEELERQLQAIGEANTTDSFVIAFSKLSPTIQAVFVFIILQLLLPIVQNIAANIITPHVEKIISASDTTEREKVKQLKSLGFDDLDLSTFRFITTPHLYLRELPNSNSRIKDDLQFGQVVMVVNKQRNWMEVSYEYENGERMQGWVFSRYTEKFRK